MTVGVVLVAFAPLAAALFTARRDRARHDRTVEDIIARRYTQPRRIGSSWSDDTISTATSVRTHLATGSATGPTSRWSPLAASGCNSEQTAHAPRAHAGSTSAALQARRPPTPSRRFGAPDGVGLLAPTRDTTPHPTSGRRRI